MVKYCINHDEPEITEMFNYLDENHQQGEWVEKFTIYIQDIQEKHMKLVLEELAREGGLEVDKLAECREDVVKGIYEVYCQTQDREDTLDSLERALRKLNSPR